MEPTLGLQIGDYQAKVATFLGWGRGAAYGESKWSDQQAAFINDAVQSGLRRFYYPPPMEGSSTAYDWSFLHPTANIDLPQGTSGVQSIVNLPDDFGGFEGKLTVLTVKNTSMPWRIEWRNEGVLREAYALTPTMTGPPMFASTLPIKGTTATASQRFQLFIFPTADQDYSLQGQYWINPDYLSGAFPYAYGGPQHVETILESCLAVAEERQDDSRTVHAVAFEERLAASISMDRKLKPQKLGRSVDRSDNVPWQPGNQHYYAPAATYNGTPFD